MSTITKVNAELAQQSSDTSSSPTVLMTRAASPAVSSSPVCVELPVRVRGLHADAPAGSDPALSDSFTEDTHTLILFPRGAVVRLAAAVTVGQEVMLTNLGSNQHVHCKVITVRSSETAKGYVELEFTHRTTAFWGSTVGAPKTAPSTGMQESSPAIDQAEPPAAALKAAFGAALKPPFDVTAQSTAPLAAVKTTRIQHLPAAPAVSAVAALAATAEANGSPASLPLQRSRPAAAEPRLDVQAAKNRIAGDLQTGRKWTTLGGAMAAVVLAMACGAFLLRSRPAITATTPANGNVAVAQTAAATTLLPQILEVKAASEPPSTPAAAAVSETRRPASIPAAAPSEKTGEGNKPGAVSDLLQKVATKLHLRAGNSKVIASTRAVRPAGASQDEAPAIVADYGSSTSSGGPASSGIVSSGLGSVAPPPAKLAVPVPAPSVQATLPRAISVVKPRYPSAAKSAHIEGDVVIQAEIDPLGKVVGTKVISGPVLLQTAAVEALQQWKYEPAKLGGQPVAGKTTVSLNFRLP